MTVREWIEKSPGEHPRAVGLEDPEDRGYGVQVVCLSSEDLEILKQGGVLRCTIMDEYGCIIVGPRPIANEPITTPADS